MTFREYHRGSAYGVGQPNASYRVDDGEAGESFDVVTGINIVRAREAECRICLCVTNHSNLEILLKLFKEG